MSGLKIPHKIELHRANDAYEISVTRAAINGTVGERVFDFPKKSQVQLPDLKTLFKEIDDNQKAIDKIKENYAGTRSEEETEYDKAGKVTKHDLKEYSFFYLDGDEISTLTKKDGQPLSDDEQKKENEKTQKEIEDIQKRKEKKDAKEEKAKEEGKEEKDDDDVGIETFLRACQFVNPRRERFRGQDVLVFDFEPIPNSSPTRWWRRSSRSWPASSGSTKRPTTSRDSKPTLPATLDSPAACWPICKKGTSFAFEQAFYQRRGLAADLRRSSRRRPRPTGERNQGQRGHPIFRLQEI